MNTKAEKHAKKQAGPTEFQNEEMKEYGEKMGRWRKSALEGLESWKFEAAVRVADRLLQPLQHLHGTVLKTHAPGEHGSLTRLVCGKAEEILGEIHKLHHPSKWEDIVCSARVPFDMRNRLNGAVLSGVCRLMSMYQQRIISRVTSAPLCLLRFAWKEPHEQDEERVSLAQRLLDSDMSTLHLVARKLRLLFTAELKVVIQSCGCVPMNLYAPWRLVSERWICHVAELEGVNNMVKGILAMSPSASLVLVDAVVGNRKDCGLGSKSSVISKWSDVAARVSHLLNETVPHFKAVRPLKADPARFAPPMPALVPHLPPGLDVDLLSRELDGANAPWSSMEWARSYNLHWMRALKKSKKDQGALVAVKFHDPIESGKVWLVTHTYKYFAYLLQCVVGETGVLEPAWPAKSMSSLDVFAHWHSRICGPNKVDVEMMDVTVDSSATTSVPDSSSHVFAMTSAALPMKKQWKRTTKLLPMIMDGPVGDDDAGATDDVPLLAILDEEAGCDVDVAEELDTEGLGDVIDSADVKLLQGAERATRRRNTNAGKSSIAPVEVIAENSDEDIWQDGVDDDFDMVLDGLAAEDLNRAVEKRGIRKRKSESFTPSLAFVAKDNAGRIFDSWTSAVRSSLGALSHRETSWANFSGSGVWAGPWSEANMLLVELKHEGGAQTVELVSRVAGDAELQVVPIDGKLWKYQMRVGLWSSALCVPTSSCTVISPDVGIRIAPTMYSLGSAGAVTQPKCFVVLFILIGREVWERTGREYVGFELCMFLGGDRTQQCFLLHQLQLWVNLPSANVAACSTRDR